jgi:glutamate dehydrogenase
LSSSSSAASTRGRAIARSRSRVARIEQAIDDVESLDQDRILRNFLAVIQAMLRTNYFQRDGEGADPKPYLSFKLDPSALPWLPLPRPRFEIFVYSPRLEGVHLRGGRVARGGLRWSDRREDFRTEVLGLMKAQMVKNAVIVPVGAKGGFVVKCPPRAREDLPAEVESCYRLFIRGLLDLTDNYSGDEVVPPPGSCATTRTTPTSSSAADRGTATLSTWPTRSPASTGSGSGTPSPRAAPPATTTRRWGSRRAARGSRWRRHFRELELDTRSEDFTVVGVGDMSGDVFGNGMLLSEHIRLVGAFDHRDIFLDPNPDAAKSFEERRRLFALPRSSWADYDESLISPGGGVFSRAAKSIPLSPEMRAVLEVEEEAMTPHELIRRCCARQWTCSGTAASAPTSRRAPRRTRTPATRPTTTCAWTQKSCAAGSTARAAPRASPSARGSSSTRGRAREHRRDRQLRRLWTCSDHKVNIKSLLDVR